MNPSPRPLPCPLGLLEPEGTGMACPSALLRGLESLDTTEDVRFVGRQGAKRPFALEDEVGKPVAGLQDLDLGLVLQGVDRHRERLSLLAVDLLEGGQGEAPLRLFRHLLPQVVLDRPYGGAAALSPQAMTGASARSSTTAIRW